MSRYLTGVVPVFFLSLVAGLGTLPVRAAFAAEPERPVLDAETPTIGRFLVKLWKKPGAFESVKLASLGVCTLYVAGAPRGLEAIDPDTGAIRWIHIGRFPVDARPTELENLVYLVEGGNIVTLDVATGVEQSRSKTRVGILTPIYPTETSWVVGSGDDRVYGMQPNSGRRLWRVTLDDRVTASTWSGGNMAYFTTARGTLCAVSLRTRELAWQHKFRKRAVSPPIVAGKCVYIGSEDFHLYAFDSVSGSPMWKVLLAAPVLDAPLVTSDRIYAPTRDGLVHALDLNTQKELWTLQADSVLTVAAERVIYLRRNEGGIPLVGVAEAATGKSLAEATAMKYEIFVASPETGIFYAVGPTGDVLAIGDRTVAEQRRVAKETK